MDWNLEKENLERLILTDKVSYEEIGRMYGCTGSNIRRVAKKLNINTVKRRSINANETFNKGRKLVVRYCLNCGKEFVKHSSSYAVMLVSKNISINKNTKIFYYIQKIMLELIINQSCLNQI